MMMRRFLVVWVALAGLTAVLAIQAQGTTKGQGNTPQITTGKDGQPSINVGALAKVERELAEKYSAFEKSLLTLSQRLANSADDKDKARAAQLQKVVETASGLDISAKFNQFVKFLNSQPLLRTTGEIDEAVRQSMTLAKDLKEILELLRNDNGAGNKKEERIALEKLVKEIERLILEEQVVRSQIPTNPDNKAIAKDQVDVARKTGDLESKLGGKGGERDPKDLKGAAKEAGKGTKAEGKDLGKDGEGSKAGDAKDPGKEGSAQAKASGKKGEPGDEQKEAKGDAKKGSNADKAGETKAADSKNGEAKNGDPKNGESSKAQAKAGSPSQSQGESKPGKDSKSQGSAKSGGQPSDQPPQAADGKSDNQPSPKGSPGDPKDGIANAKKRVQEAQQHMERVTDEIAKGQRDPAGKEADQAVEKLEAARRKLEELLRQLREEELERTLAALINRCQKMLAMQEEVLRGTLRVQAQVETNPGQKADRDNILASLNLSDDELKIVYEATKAIEILETEGSAIAFPEVFQQVREDMKHVQRRLKNTDVGDITVTIEQDIVETLKEMIKALEKAKKDMEKKDPKKSEDSPPPKQQDQKLLDKIAELKMLKSMQLRVNARTELYGKRFQGEQAMTEDIRVELRELAGRQERIYEVTNKMAKGDN